MIYVIIGIILLILVIGIVLYKVYEKKRIIESINCFMADYKRRLGSFIEK